MNKRIRDTTPAQKRIRDSSPTQKRVDVERVRKALGAEATTEKLESILAPLTLLAVREEIVARLRSSGGRPALQGTDRRAKIPVNDGEWQLLEQLATAVAMPGFAPSAGQVASVLLSLSLRSAANELDVSQKPKKTATS
jgi:hypothetical protein